MRDHNYLVELIRTLPAPALLSDLRARVLATATPLVKPGLTWSDRMWFSCGCRMAAAGAFLVLLALNWWPPRRATVPDVQANDTARATVTAEAERLASELNMTDEERRLVEEQLLRQFETQKRQRPQPLIIPEGDL